MRDDIPQPPFIYEGLDPALQAVARKLGKHLGEHLVEPLAGQFVGHGHYAWRVVHGFAGHRRHVARGLMGYERVAVKIVI